MLVRGTRAWRILLGLSIFGIVYALSGPASLNLRTLHWMLDKATPLGPVALVILFLPELRQAIEGMGRLGFQLQHFGEGGADRLAAHTIKEIVSAVTELAADRTGALIVIEKGVELQEVVATGVSLNAKVSSALLGSIFYDQNPLHDGAAIIRGDQILAAACRLPLSESSRIDTHVHMRHRAAVGISEAVDCLTIVVSEERGTISIADAGALIRLSTPSELRERLHRELNFATTKRPRDDFRKLRIRKSKEESTP